MTDDIDKHPDNETDDSLLPFDEHVEEVQVGDKKVRHKGVYLLPNLFTTTALFSGFYAIITATQGKFEVAAIAIFVAMLFDGMDGRVARLTNTSSAFGEQYDSLSDMVSFGLAPALVIFNWALADLGKFGWAAAFGFAACAALRLARFNTQIGKVDKGEFVGLASPSAAALIAATVWSGSNIEMNLGLSILAALLTVIAALLMVSNVRYSSFKNIDFKGRVPFVKMLAVVLIFVVVSINPPNVLLAMALLYAFSGPALWVWQRKSMLAPKLNRSADSSVGAETVDEEAAKKSE
ncbi:CDP-diacylglycerol--serine O-phosphatidyltransferase [Gilvimarinus sp. SDUM040013]|uniref:CDP-diacylglycerol--serine O-phosphatidyltransferase n=1 Tax=Gilvimarinus gilvus TaxID=3058038 RepID=A0ABU4S0M4_9GAMM|nr:CDP-diacylglycerol--serine O-phosphatidyltransferase [Gilvimarinus sp. SDUM040013]MDO3384865.1 CDP-diacylglycerol--serine O-phosphatidyltransferase [Gilvimarinus sp. SDUM040013]MDX6850710.1 CDP-diacylglycerol--serine O-phosphatidyltransferase [Gilvimarinus sp. SDUM040013]